MARVRCSCGRSYTIPDQHIGRRVKCAACKRTFVAAALPDAAPARAAPSPKRAPSPAAPSPKPAAPRAGERPVHSASRRIGEMAVERGFITHEQLDACIEYQEGVHKLPPLDNLRLGRLLLTRRLLTKPQIRRLLEEQTLGTAEAVGAAEAAEAIAARKKSYGQAVTAEQREAVRKQVEAAERRHVEKRQAVRAEAALLEPSRLRPIHILLGVVVVVGAILVVTLWPAPAAERTLAAYLRSSDEAAVAPDATLALADLGLAVRDFSDLKMLPATEYSYAEELEAYSQKEEGGPPRAASDRWDEFLEAAAMPQPKRAALELLIPALPDTLKPTKVGTLRITVQPITCRLVYRPRGMGEYREGQYRFTLVAVQSPHWSCGWKVAAFSPVVGKGQAGAESGAGGRGRG